MSEKPFKFLEQISKKPTTVRQLSRHMRMLEELLVILGTLPKYGVDPSSALESVAISVHHLRQTIDKLGAVPTGNTPYMLKPKNRRVLQ